jgi:predicted RecB family nuclease
MQDFGNGKLVFSASDLAIASECQWAQVRRIDKALGHKITVPKDDDPMLERAGLLGGVHERKQLESYRSQFPGKVIEIERPDYDDKSKLIQEQMLELSAKTLDALNSKAPVVFQATFFDGEFQGFADFLVLTHDGEYAVYDTKLARKAKITALIQLAAYAHQLKLNGIPTSSKVHLILGDQRVTTHNIEDIMPTYLLRRKKMKALIASRLENKNSNGQPSPWNDPKYLACGRCVVCDPHVTENDDLLLIADMRSDQRAKLMTSGVTTATKLAESAPEKIDGLNQKSYEKIQGQAQIQLETKRKQDPKKPAFNLFNPIGLEALPDPNPGDIFFDFEGDPLYQEGTFWNLDYLFGYVDEASKFEPIWAHDIAGEKVALEDFVAMVKDRLEKNPGMHIYHYASYEKTHLLSLSARHGVAEEFVDDLLRNNVLVDLYPIVRRSLLIGASGYSLKKLEGIFMSEKERMGVSNAVDSVLEYSKYCELIADQKLDEAKLKLANIEQYNEYDCKATLGLRNWLLELARENNVELKGSGDGDAEVPDSEPQHPLFEALMKLIEDVPVSERTPDQTAIALSAAAIEFHRREDRIFWSEHYGRLEEPIEDWQDTRDVYVVKSVEIERDWHKEGNQRNLRRHLKIHASPAPGSTFKSKSKFLLYPESSDIKAVSPEPGARVPVNCSIINIIDDSTFIVEELAPANGAGHDLIPVAVVPGTPPYVKSIETAIELWSQRVLESYPSLFDDPALDMLRMRSPFANELPPVNAESAATDIAKTLLGIESGTLAVQGPPGSGKSFNGGKVIADLVMNHGWKVGVVAQSHATVLNLLKSVAKAGLSKELIGKGVDKLELAAVTENPPDFWTPYSKGTDSTFTYEHDSFVIGGTIFDFTKSAQIPPGTLDLIVIDEAGQFSLANTIAASTVASRMLLLGDPQQLPQVTQGTHPEPVDGSALGWLAGGEEVMPSKFGYFLPNSWRMNEGVCKVVSENFYDSKLKSSATARSLEGIEAGFYPIAVNHSANSTESVEEADHVVEIVRDLLNRQWADRSYNGKLSGAKENIIVVAPYNAQVQLVKSKLVAAGFDQIPVGTVDKFQGQEAAVAIVSMTASSAIDVPRGIEFLLMPNRLNVAISRAKWAAYLVYSPGLLDYKPTNVDNLKLLSRFINLVEKKSL